MNPFELPLLPGDVAIVEIGHTYVGGSARERLFTDREASVTAAVDGLAVRLITRVRHPKPSVITLGIPVLAALAGAARYWARERKHWASTRRAASRSGAARPGSRCVPAPSCFSPSSSPSSPPTSPTAPSRSRRSAIRSRLKEPA